MPHHAAKKGVAFLGLLLFLQPLLVVTQHELHRDNVDSRVEELRVPHVRHDRKQSLNTRDKAYIDAHRITTDLSALATIAQPSFDDAVATYPAKQPGKSAGLSPQVQARSIRDWEVEDFVLLATVDGMIHATNRKTGVERWALQTDGAMVETIYHRNRSDPGGARPFDDYLWIIEPTRDGNIYIYTSGTADTGLQKLPVTLKQLVEDHSPWSGVDPPVVYNAEKKTSLYTIDAATGNIMKYFSSRPSHVEPDSCRRVNNLEQAIEGEKEECESRGTLTLGRIEYTVSIQSGETGEHICTLRYFEWIPNNQDLDLQSQYIETMDSRHIYTMYDGRILGYNYAPESSRPNAYNRKFSTPVARVFDVARPMNVRNKDTPLIVLPQPPKPPFSDDGQFEDRNSQVFINSTEEGSWYALSEQVYPGVTDGAHRAKIYDSDYIATLQQFRSSNIAEQRKTFGGVHSIHGFDNSQRRLPMISGPLDAGNDTPHELEPRRGEIIPVPAIQNSVLLRALNNYSFDIILTALLLLITTFLYVNKDNWNRLLRRKMDVRKIVPALQQTLASAPSTPMVDEFPRTFSAPPGATPKTGMKKDNGEGEEWTMVDEKAASDAENGEGSQREGDAEEPVEGLKKKKARRGRRGGVQHRKKKTSEDNGQTNGDFDPIAAINTVNPTATLEQGAYKISPTSFGDPIEVDGSIQIGQLRVSSEVLGHGSQGTLVFRGSFDGRDVAVKRLLKHFYDIASHEVSLLQESDDHANVIRYYCREQANNFLYIALELCPASLQDVIEKPDAFASLIGTGINVPDALKQITAGVRHLHSLKIVHRDVKPQNILVAAPRSRKGMKPGIRLLISDFGLCKKLDDDQSSFRATTAHAAGTSGFRAPELLVDDDEAPKNGTTTTGDTSEPAVVDPQTNRRATRAIDIFSLGCVFYYVLTGGGHPFDEGGKYLREANIIKGKHNLNDLQKLGDYAFEADDLIRQMLAMNPKDRPDATSVMLHPFFWSAEERLNFLCDVSDHFEFEKRDPPSHALQILEATAPEVMGKTMDFLKLLPTGFKDTLGKQRKYTGSKMLDLLRALRNKKSHYQDMPDTVKAHVGPLPHGYLQFWTVRFPNLLINCHCAVIECRLEGVDRFKRYFTLVE